MVRLALEGALRDIGGSALDVGIEIIGQRKLPQPFAAGRAGSQCTLRKPASVVSRPLMRSVSAYTQAPVSVAKSIIARGLRRAASASVSASAIRPSASVWITWMVVPFMARTTSCGR